MQSHYFDPYSDKHFKDVAISRYLKNHVVVSGKDDKNKTENPRLDFEIYFDTLSSENPLHFTAQTIINGQLNYYKLRYFFREFETNP